MIQKVLIKAVSEAIRANTVLLQASKDISLESATHTQRIEEQSSNSGASLGVNLGTTGILGIDASVSRGRGNTVSQVVTHAPMSVGTRENLSIEAGRDISLVGATLQGDRAIVKAGQNLTIQSVQDKKDYTSKTKETGLSVSIQPTGRIGSIGGAYNIGETQSQYASVTSQAGIYAGAGGLTVDVGDTTQLTGAVLHSEATPSKNVVKTGTLVMEDIHNVAEYTSKSKGFSYVYDDEYEQAKRKLQAKEPLSPGEIHTLNNLHNQVGLLPDLSVGTYKKETLVTQSAITDGQLLITDGVIDIETINRDTTQSLHMLQDIFDAKSVKEKEELARLLSKNINEGIHILSEHKHWAEGSPQKIALHALSAGLSAQVAKGDFLAGAVAGGTNEALLPKLQQMLATDDPAVLQAASAILGYATNKTLGKDGRTGAALAQYGTKWNELITFNPGKYAYYDNYLQAKMDQENYVRNEFIEIDEEKGSFNNMKRQSYKAMINLLSRFFGIPGEVTYVSSDNNNSYTFNKFSTVSKKMVSTKEFQDSIKFYLAYNGTGNFNEVNVFSKNEVLGSENIKHSFNDGRILDTFSNIELFLAFNRSTISFTGKLIDETSRSRIYYTYGFLGDKFKFRDSDSWYNNPAGVINAVGADWQRTGAINPTEIYVEFEMIVEVNK
ncbi:hemagglutinin repeat-containing protein [Veillonella sp. R32]|uniref:hemagglutinin repeat-containing protein n=1 Tax=Veillonella sp. R32 TaxID=2021312 RepID=UPI001389FE0E|nr:hemagglutinin repeat-containing protein [Veillonella sp. R32]